MAKKSTYTPGEHKYEQAIPPDLNLDLHAFCEVFWHAPKNEVVRRAIRAYIESELSERNVEAMFMQVRERLDPGLAGGPRLLAQESPEYGRESEAS